MKFKYNNKPVIYLTEQLDNVDWGYSDDWYIILGKEKERLRDDSISVAIQLFNGFSRFGTTMMLGIDEPINAAEFIVEPRPCIALVFNTDEDRTAFKITYGV